MMMGLKVLMMTPLLIGIKGQAGNGCLDKKRFNTQIVYNLRKDPIKFNFLHSRDMLTRRTQEGIEEWKQKHAGNAWVTPNSKWHTNGLAVGGMRLETQYEMVAQPYDMYGAYYCPYVKKITVDVIYSTEIFVAREIEKGTCEFDAVMEHEFKHHDTNWTVVQTLAKRMEADTPKIISFLERRYVSIDKVQDGFQYIREGIGDALDVYSGEMSARKEEFNDLVDTPEEYKRVSEKCDPKQP